MKIHIEIDCTPDEARSFLGLPDVSQANSLYVDAITRAMRGVSNPEQLQEYASKLAPMGQMGLKLFQSFVEGNLGAAGFGAGKDTGSAGTDRAQGESAKGKRGGSDDPKSARKG